jgi:hypothetical protein
MQQRKAYSSIHKLDVTIPTAHACSMVCEPEIRRAKLPMEGGVVCPLQHTGGFNEADFIFLKTSMHVPAHIVNICLLERQY